MKPNFLYIANWKAYLSYSQSYEWVIKNKNALQTLAKNKKILICPSFDALATLTPLLQELSIQIGAQDCSPHNPGAYTGQVLAQSLKEIGCIFCIIGHAEALTELCQTTQMIVAKACILLAKDITPIICIGDSKTDYESNIGTQAIEQQLEPILRQINITNSWHKTLCIAYEPLWAIGSTTLANTEYIHKQLQAIQQLVRMLIPGYTSYLLYGGGIDETTINAIKNIDILDGALVGKASTDFQKFEKIVLS